MNLRQVTITGADDSVDPKALVDLSTEFAFVEWGILISRNNMGSARFPSLDWIRRLQALPLHSGLNLSLHVCGRWTRQLLLGIDELPPLLAGCNRIQLNFHAEHTSCIPGELKVALKLRGKRQFIFQVDGNGGNEHLQSLYEEDTWGDINAVPLFDLSGGAGIMPEKWPTPISQLYHGYAGGLGPQNLAKQIPLIAAAAEGRDFWIDMETRVRSENDSKFDLAKVRCCLEIAAPFVAQREVA